MAIVRARPKIATEIFIDTSEIEFLMGVFCNFSAHSADNTVGFRRSPHAQKVNVGHIVAVFNLSSHLNFVALKQHHENAGHGLRLNFPVGSQ